MAFLVAFGWVGFALFWAVSATWDIFLRGDCAQLQGER